jgi:hypothetical protein
MLHSAIKRPLAPAPSPHHSLTQPPPGLSALETERLPVVFTDILATYERSYDTSFEKSDRMHVATVDFTPGGPVSVRTAPAVPSATAAPLRELRGVEELSFVSGSFQASDLIPGLAPLVDDGRVEKVGIGGRALGSNAQNLAPIGAPRRIRRQCRSGHLSGEAECGWQRLRLRQHLTWWWYCHHRGGGVSPHTWRFRWR